MTTPAERTFDRLPEFDPKSRLFPIRSLVAGNPIRGYTWRCDANLNQGREGACVGFSWAHELAARPVPVRGLTNDKARSIYFEAQRVDEWEGETYEGTSVLAGAKVLQRQGLIGEYRWAFGLTDLLLALGYKGPAVLGLNWHEGMFEPDNNGFIHPTGQVLGGHAIMANAVSKTGRYVRLHNSWGPDWGQNGSAKISWDDLDILLREQGEACIPTGRRKEPTA